MADTHRREWTPEELSGFRRAAAAELLYRAIVPVLILTLPIWILPAMLWSGWKEVGQDTLASIPDALRYIRDGERFGQHSAFAVWRNPAVIPGPHVTNFKKEARHGKEHSAW